MYALNNGNVFPLIGLGTYRIKGEDEIMKVIDAGFKAGYRSIDTASVYGNEIDIGNAIERLSPRYGLKRRDIFITTKLAPRDHGKGVARKAVLSSLKNLKLSYIDLYLIHWPGVEKVDVKSELNSKLRKESWYDLVELHKEGILHNIGVSNYSISHLQELLNDCGGVKPVINQVEFHPMQKPFELLNFCKSHNILLQAYCSLGGTGNSQFLLNNDLVKMISKEVNKTSAQVLLKWALQHGVAIIPKSVTPERIASNISLDFELSKNHMMLLDSIDISKKFAWEPSIVK